MTQYTIVNVEDYQVYMLGANLRDQVIRNQMRQLSRLDGIMDYYNLYYGKRLINSQKRYRIVANQK